MSYYTSGHYASTKPIIHDVRYDPKYSSRAPSTDSRGSYFSRSSAEYSGRSSTGYCGSAEESKRKHRVPDNDRQYISSTTRGGTVQTVNHREGRYDYAEPRSSEATRSEHTSHSRSHKSSSGSHSHSHSHSHNKKR